MGTRGPVPARSSQRRRRNKVEIDKVVLDDEVLVPKLGLTVHPIAAEFYASLHTSGQARFYEPSDWQRARITTKLLSDLLESGKPSAMLYAALQRDFEALLVSEGDRRRVRMEIERGTVDSSEEDAKVAVMDRYRKARG